MGWIFIFQLFVIRTHRFRTALMALLLAQAFSAAAEGWVNCSPEGGSLNISIDFDQQRMLARPEGQASLWASHVYNTKWTQIDSTPDLPFFGLHGHHFGDTLYGMALTTTTGNSDLLLARSFDRGKNWQFVPFPHPKPESLLGFSVNASDPAVIYAASRKSVYRSADAGTSWTLLWQADVDSTIDDIVCARSHPRTLYLCGYEINAMDLRPILKRSDDEGQTWIDLKLPAIPADVSFRGFSGVAVDRANHHRIALAAGLYPKKIGDLAPYYTSEDGGNSWQVGTIPFSSTRQIEFDPNDSRHLIAIGARQAFPGALEIARSRDGGATWQLDTRFGGQCRFAIFPGQPGVIILLTTEAIYRSIDSGQTWSRADQGLRFSRIFDLSAHGGNLFALKHLKGLAHSADSGAAWDQPTTPNLTVQFRRVSLNPDHPHELLALQDTVDNPNIQNYEPNPRLLRSDDGGNVWVEPDSGGMRWTALARRRGAPQNVLIAGSEPRHFAAWLNVSNDGGATWTTPTRIFDGYYLNVKAIGIGTDPRMLYVTGNTLNKTAFIGKSNDSGKTWVGAAGNLSSLSPQFGQGRDLCVDPIDPRHVFFACDAGLFVSHDYAVHWARAFPGQIRVYDIELDADKRMLYIATATGVHRAPMDALQWEHLLVRPFTPDNPFFPETWDLHGEPRLAIDTPLRRLYFCGGDLSLFSTELDHQNAAMAWRDYD